MVDTCDWTTQGRTCAHSLRRPRRLGTGTDGAGQRKVWCYSATKMWVTSSGENTFSHKEGQKRLKMWMGRQKVGAKRGFVSVTSMMSAVETQKQSQKW